MDSDIKQILSPRTPRRSQRGLAWVDPTDLPAAAPKQPIREDFRGPTQYALALGCIVLIGCSSSYVYC
jgi:hypothetical protein